MTDRDQPISPLRRRMTEDMEVRGFTACTQRGYIAAVRNFTAFLGRSPDQADKEDLRRFQHHMRTNGASASTVGNQTPGAERVHDQLHPPADHRDLRRRR